MLLNATDAILNTRAVRRYIEELARGPAPGCEEDELDLLFLTHRLLRLRRVLRGMRRRGRVRARAYPLPRRLIERRTRAGRPLPSRFLEGVDLYHESCFDSPSIPGVPVVTTIHGLAYLVRPDLAPAPFVERMTTWLERAVTGSSHFICVSETTRGELLSRFPIDPERASTIPLGVSSAFRPGDTEESRAHLLGRFRISGRFILYLGGIQPNKNIPFLLRVFARLASARGFRGALVLAGDVHYARGELEAMIDREGITGRVHILGLFPPGDPALVHLYRAAEMLLFPTLYEGWASPPLEAMACGTPVVASCISSLPETVADGGLLLDPTDEDAWIEGCRRLLYDDAWRARLTARGSARAARFPWRRTVESTWELYRRITGAPAALPAPRATAAEVGADVERVSA
ncbi:MAG: glycosyltransferase family 4 protein [Planctomycetota bacterium]